jgi:hypothetical protein
VASGPNETIKAKHRLLKHISFSILDQITNASEKFPTILNKIDNFKSRELEEEEQHAFAEYAIRGRYNYRTNLPKKLFSDLQQTTTKLLQTRRKEDEGNSAWVVYNRVQENLIKGIEGFSRPITGYYDSLRTNQLLWKGAETSLGFERQLLKAELNKLLVKDGIKGKISA